MALARAVILCCHQGEAWLWDLGGESGLFAAAKCAAFHAEQIQRH